MRKLPVYRQAGGKLRYGKGKAYLMDQDGTITWSANCDQGYVFVGACIRSGTVYTTKLLQAIGCRVEHERPGANGSVGYHLAVMQPDNCLHQVRHPVNQISSMMAHQSWGFVPQAMKLPDKQLLGCMTYWLEWNKRLEDFCVWQYRLENLSNVWDEFLEHIEHIKVDMPDIPKNTNTHNKGDFKKYTWDDLFAENNKLAQDILDKAKQYGYETP